MKYGLISSLILVFILKTVVSAAPKAANFNDNQGILNLPEVVIIPENSTFSATLRRLDSSELLFELNTIAPIGNSFSYYDPNKNILYIPNLALGKLTYKNLQFELVTSETETQPLRFRMIVAEVDRNAIHKIQATVETKPVPASGDAADDPAIWVHPQDPTQSIIIGTQKQGGLGIYDLNGQEIQYLADGNMNNVDLRYNFTLGTEKIAIVAASNRSNDSIALYKVNQVSRSLDKIAARTIVVGLKVYGICMYHSVLSDKYYVFINDKNGGVEQWELFDNGNGLVNATLVRRLTVSSQVEGCVADDMLGHFYLGEERVGIWKFNAEPDGNNIGHLIDTVNSEGHLTPEVEGLAIYYVSETEGYLLASNQGNDSYTVYNRAGHNEYLGTFQIITNEALNIDHVYDTDGIDVINVPLGEAFPYGVFVAQDGENIDPDENQNFKLVPWENIADTLGLKKESSYNPR